LPLATESDRRLLENWKRQHVPQGCAATPAQTCQSRLACVHIQASRMFATLSRFVPCRSSVGRPVKSLVAVICNRARNFVHHACMAYYGRLAHAIGVRSGEELLHLPPCSNDRATSHVDAPVWIEPPLGTLRLALYRMHAHLEDQITFSSPPSNPQTSGHSSHLASMLKSIRLSRRPRKSGGDAIYRDNIRSS
jgi:hypothetical protein